VKNDKLADIFDSVASKPVSKQTQFSTFDASKPTSSSSQFNPFE